MWVVMPVSVLTFFCRLSTENSTVTLYGRGFIKFNVAVWCGFSFNDTYRLGMYALYCMGEWVHNKKGSALQVQYFSKLPFGDHVIQRSRQLSNVGRQQVIKFKKKSYFPW